MQRASIPFITSQPDCSVISEISDRFGQIFFTILSRKSENRWNFLPSTLYQIRNLFVAQIFSSLDFNEILETFVQFLYIDKMPNGSGKYFLSWWLKKKILFAMKFCFPSVAMDSLNLTIRTVQQKSIRAYSITKFNEILIPTFFSIKTHQK